MSNKYSKTDPSDYGNNLMCKVYPCDTLRDYKYVVVCSFYKGQFLLSRRRDRSTWETQGGHIENGEAPLEAARRELYEESGVKDAVLTPVCDYLGWTEMASANGMVFLAEVNQLGLLPESEMSEVHCFNTLPEQLTYPNVTPHLFQCAQQKLSKSD